MRCLNRRSNNHPRSWIKYDIQTQKHYEIGLVWFSDKRYRCRSMLFSYRLERLVVSEIKFCIALRRRRLLAKQIGRVVYLGLEHTFQQLLLLLFVVRDVCA